MATFTAYHVTSAEGMSEHMTLEAATMHFLKVSGPCFFVLSSNCSERQRHTT